MKKILFLLTSSSPYGADLSILTNVNYLQKEKKIDTIFIIREKGKLEKYLKKNCKGATLILSSEGSIFLNLFMFRGKKIAL